MIESDMQQKQNPDKKTALVLGGGGARGSYQIGVWQGLIELGIDFQIVTGTSVGALNGGLIVQGDYQAAKEMWQAIDTSHVLEFESPVDATSFKGYRKTVGTFVFNALRQKGISALPLKNSIIDRLLDEDRMRKQGIEFGIVLTEFPAMRQVSVFLDEIPQGLVSLYLLGSASFFPAMQPTKIGTKSYVDGGYHDNIPIDLAISKGATNLIVVDVKGPGITKAIKLPAEATVHQIVSKWPLGAVLLFDGARSEFNIRLGYLETLKSYGKLAGSWYSFKNEAIVNHEKLFYQKFVRLLNDPQDFFIAAFYQNEKNQELLLKRIRGAWRGRVGKKELSYAIHELTGKLFQLNPTKIYSFSEFNQAILEKYEAARKAIETASLAATFEIDMIYSGDEWLDNYAQMIPFISNLKMVLYFVDLLEAKQGRLMVSKNLQWLIYRKPVAFMMATYIYQLKKMIK
ncbi:patatin-like phospholipase family protein [Carnobacterium maltaromaticum]|uniref:patatin-like phospholipase family protein n=1 Tax=Carnobacterium maltaromaticum TaxID=2751 RepID=UPI00165B780B|nr:patatin-like phospholipase family protein [Carnobacterium maltaromaticum]MBC9788003.1 patatin-like phospholipase family protein [Carnobacterium maltaromaticum]